MNTSTDYPKPTEPTSSGTVAIIPARGGSKGIPLKNLQKIAGTTLVARAVQSAQATPGIDLVVVSTDHDQIASEAQNAGALVVRRPAELADDTASSESALLYTLDRLADAGTDPQITVFIQCTSPFIDPGHLDTAVARVENGAADSVFSAVEDHSFLWTLDGENHALAVGHSADFRPRRQDRPRHFNETGAFYVMRTEGLRAHRHRFFGRIEIQEVPEEDSREIDSMADLSALRIAAHQRAVSTALDVDAVVTDFDGVHTDDAAFVDENGKEQVRINRGDGLGVARLRDAKIPFLILSKERNPVVTRRAEKLRVQIAQGIDDKATTLLAWMAENNLDPARVAYVGNDINDLEAFNQVGWPIAVADAHPSVTAAARLVLKAAGGRGAVREVCDMIRTIPPAQPVLDTTDQTTNTTNLTPVQPTSRLAQPA